jgi:predicted PurR-regulated permease PerM
MNNSNTSDAAVTQAIEISIRLGLIFLIVGWCLMILMPFVSVIVWGAIIAIAVYAPFLLLTEKMGGQKKLAATLFSLGGIALILTPVIFLSISLVESATSLGTHIADGTLKLPAPPENVRSWPLIGEKVYGLWHLASANIIAFAQKFPEQISHIGVTLIGLAAGVSGGILQFFVSMLIAGAFLSSADTTGGALQRLFIRLAGERGAQLVNLSTATVRSVAVGVLGIAVIQGILAGIGMMLADVPAAGLIAFVVLVFAIAQLPPILVLAPVIFYVFSASSTIVAIIFMIWAILVSMSDMVLKPMLLGRGVDAPMLVILLGAIGGMITSGIVGLFTGAVILALGYKLMQAWILAGEPAEDESVAEQN